MNPRLRQLVTLIAALLVISLSAESAHAAGSEHDRGSITTITLRSTVRITPAHETLTLGDLAEIAGPQAEQLQTLAIESANPIASGVWTTIPLRTIRQRIEDDATLRAGSIVVRGGDIALTRRSDEKKTYKTSNGNGLGKSQDGAPMLRDALEQWIYARPWLANTPRDAIRLIFGDSARDKELLGTPIAGRRVILRELGRSARVSIQIVIYDNEVLITETTIRLDVQTLRPVRVTRTQIRRDELVDAERTGVEMRWIAPTEPIIDPAESLGQACIQTIDPGTMLLVSMLEQPVLVERGRIVSARSLSGSVSVTMSVRALADGRLGEVIELESRDRKQHFTARVAGPGRVVIVPDEPQTPSPSDS